jgi:hypothetical protein
VWQGLILFHRGQLEEWRDELGMVGHTCNLNTCVREKQEDLEFQDSLGYISQTLF